MTLAQSKLIMTLAQSKLIMTLAQSKPSMDFTREGVTACFLVESKNPEHFDRLSVNVVEGLFMSWFVYIAKARAGRLYTGITTDDKRRIDAHNLGKNSRFAIQQGPLKLAYTSDPFSNKSEARKREVQIKGWSREKKMKLIRREWK